VTVVVVCHSIELNEYWYWLILWLLSRQGRMNANYTLVKGWAMLRRNLLVTWIASSVDRLHKLSFRYSWIHFGSLPFLSALANRYNHKHHNFSASISVLSKLWSATISLVVCEQRIFLIFLRIWTHTNRPILAIFHATIFSGSLWLRDKICKWFSSLKRLKTLH